MRARDWNLTFVEQPLSNNIQQYPQYKTGMSPLYPGQWKNFLGVYAGFYVISNFLRPFRVTLAIAIGPYFDRLINWIQRKTRLPKAAAITATVLLVNLGGTILLMIGGLSMASLLSGVPIFPPKA